MSAIHWLVRAMVWLILYLSLLVVYRSTGRWLIARFQQRPTDPVLTLNVGKNRIMAVVLLTALIAGAMIPLSPAITIGSWQLEHHLLGHSSVALLAVLIVQWLGDMLLLFEDRYRRFSPVWQVPAAVLIDALPMLLIVLGLLLTRNQNSLQLTAWIAAQDGWNGLRWMALAQPLLALLWLVCARPRWETRTSSTWARSALAFNRALLASVLLFGGWQGPFVNQWPWLGLLYTAIKTIVVGSIWTWARATLPRASLTAHSRTVQQVWVPLVILNLIVTALFVVVS